MKAEFCGTAWMVAWYVALEQLGPGWLHGGTGGRMLAYWCLALVALVVAWWQTLVVAWWSLVVAWCHWWSHGGTGGRMVALVVAWCHWPTGCIVVLDRLYLR